MSHHPSLGDLVDYLAHDLSGADEERIEEHYFGCEACTRRLEAVERLADDVVAVLLSGQLYASVTASELTRLEREGLVVRRYSMAPGESVQCTAAPDDDVVVVHLHGPFPTGAGRMEVHCEDFGDGSLAGTVSLDVAVEDGVVAVIMPGDLIRSYPRSRWTFSLQAEDRSFGPFQMNHSPWDEGGSALA